MILLSHSSWGQTATVQPKIMVIPYAKQDEDITTIIENDVNKRIVLAKSEKHLTAEDSQQSTLRRN